MAPSALQVWGAAIKAVRDLETAVLVEGLGKHTYPGLVVNHHFTKDVDSVSLLPQQSTATWRKLVDSKVPYCLAEACCKVLTRLEDSSCRNKPQTINPTPAALSASHSILQNGRAALLGLLRVLLQNVLKDGITLNAGQQAYKLAAAIGQQLQESGLLQLLPRLINSIADDLSWQLHSEAGDTATTVETASGVNQAARTDGSGSSSTGHSTQAPDEPVTSSWGPADRSSDDGHTSGTRSAAQVLQNEAAAVCAIIVHSYSTCMPKVQFEASIAQGCSAPVCRLVTLVFRRVCCQLTPASSSAGQQALSDTHLARLGDFWGTVLQAASTLLRSRVKKQMSCAQERQAGLSAGSGSSSKQASDEDLLQFSSVYLQALPIIIICSVYAYFLTTLRALPGSDSSHIIGSSTSNSSTAVGDSSSVQPTHSSSDVRSWKDPARAWQFACSSQHTALPASHLQLLQLLGGSPVGLMWCAAFLAGHACRFKSKLGSKPDEADAAAAPGEFAVVVFNHMAHQHLQHPHHHQQNQAFPLPAYVTMAPEQVQQLYYLLPTVLLYWAAHQPARLDSLNLSLVALLGMASRSTACVCVSTNHSDKHIVLPDDIHLAVLQDMLPLATKLGRQLLQQLDPHSSSTSSSSDKTDTTSAQNRMATNAGNSLDGTLCKLAVLLSFMAVASAKCADAATHAEFTPKIVELVDASPDGATYTTVAAAAAAGLHKMVLMSSSPAMAIWAAHALEICRMLEAGFRCSPESHRTECIGAFSGLCGFFIVAPGVRYMAPLLHTAVSAGPGSAEQKQLFFTLCSLIKLLQHGGISSLTASSFNHWTCCSDMAQALQWLLPVGECGPAQPVHLEDMLPWLVLLGRCCLHLAGQLTATIQQFQLVILVTGLQQWIPAVCRWLQQPDTTAQFDAAGYNLLQQALTSVFPAGSISTDAEPEAASVTAAQLSDLGLALNNSLPIPYACNNPHCSNLSGTSELHLVNGRSCMCGGCRVAHYCSRSCQVKHWKQHKAACKALAEAKKGRGSEVVEPIEDQLQG